ncbi:amidohydrolase family protein [Phreatobacter sp. AB_2022a]|uniref:amidohydrolase family protein n=1 Tax=Phreatobacter sp. AB_2022a TaxID=3003134 RepID=UPI0022872726|nr:amidohydrolase family protein [Phreatobacter sp. AB_2022a]MCZ0733477.1 amidohydrolase family protein [Phreatobacter sp. AB_2022a]
MRKLIRNAFVVSVDPSIGNVERCDILIEGDRIAAVAPGIAAADAEIVDAEGFIASPGYVDSHHHLWQSAIRGITADWSLNDYLAGIRMFIASHYTADDIYAAQLNGALQALNAGVTTTADYCHNLNSPDHVEEAVRGVRDSGARIVWCYGFNRPPLPDPGFSSLEDRSAYLKRTAARHFTGTDDLVTLGVSPEEAWFWPDTGYGGRQFALARELGARIFWHANSTRDILRGVFRNDAGRAAAGGLLGPDVVLVHMTQTTPDEWDAVAACGCHVSMTPETEMQMNMGWPILAEAEVRGMNVGLGIDIISNNSVDLRFQLRFLLQAERWRRSTGTTGVLSPHVAIDAARALHWGTLGGARALGLDNRIGSLTPGKQADLLLHDARGIMMAGWDRNQPEGALILQCGVDTLATVLVGGRFVKRDHRLVADESRACRLLTEANARLRAQAEAGGGLAAALDKHLSRYARSNDAGAALASY